MTATVVILLALSVSPFALLLAFKRPLLFPLGLYIMLVPFDNILGTTTTITRIVAIATGGTLLFHMIASRRILAPPKSWTAWAIYMVLASLTAIWTIDPSGTGLTLGIMLQLFFFYTILAVYPAERRDVHMIGTLMVAAGTVLSLVALGQYETGFRTQEDRLTVGLNGLVLDPNHVAASLLMPIALTVGAVLSTRDIRIRLVALLSMVTMLATLFLTGSRGGLIALAAMLLYIALRTRYRIQILALMAVGGVASLLAPTVWDRFADKGLQGGSGRLFIWDVGKLAFKDHWLSGAGIGAFPAAYNHELLATFQPVFQGWSRPAHNALLSAAVELGILGATLLVFAWWRTWQDARGNVVIEASIFGLAVAAWFLDVLVFKYIWLAFGMAALVKNAAEPHFLRGGPRRTQPVRQDRLFARFAALRGRRAAAAHPSRESVTSNT